MKVIYLHGFASGPNTQKVQLLKDAGFEVIAPLIPIDVVTAESEVHYCIMNAVMSSYPSEKIVVLGTSLGGFWAARMGQYFDITTILMNPALHPEESLKKFIGSYKNYHTGEMLELDEKTVDRYKYHPVSEEGSEFRTYFIATKDTAIPKTTNR